MLASRMNLRISRSERIAVPIPDPGDPEVQLWTDHEGGICAWARTVGSDQWLHVRNVGSFSFCNSCDGVVAFVQTTTPQALVFDAYLRVVLPLVLQAQGHEVLHASAICGPLGIVAFCGISGTGKSTIAYGLNQRGYPLWADDAVVIGAAANRLEAVSLPFSLRLLPDAQGHFAESGYHHGISSATDDHADHAFHSNRLGAIVILERNQFRGSRTLVEAERIPPSAAFPCVLRHAYYYHSPNQTLRLTMVKHYLDLVEQIPVYRVRFNGGLHNLESVLDGIELLPQLGAGSMN